MELVACSTILYGEKPCHSQEKSVMEYMDYPQSNGAENDELMSPEEEIVDHVFANVNIILEPTECDVNENGQTSGDICNNEDSIEEQYQCQEACLNFQTSHVDVNTIESEPLYDNKDTEVSTSASNWREHDEALPLWVKVCIMLVVSSLLNFSMGLFLHITLRKPHGPYIL